MKKEILELFDNLKHSVISLFRIILLLWVVDDNDHKDDPNHLHLVDGKIQAYFFDQIVAERMIFDEFDNLFEGLNGVFSNLYIFGLDKGGVVVDDLEYFLICKGGLMLC